MENQTSFLQRPALPPVDGGAGLACHSLQASASVATLWLFVAGPAKVPTECSVQQEQRKSTFLERLDAAMMGGELRALIDCMIALRIETEKLSEMS